MEAVPSMWGPPGRAFAWSRGEGGDTSNPRLSRGGKPLSPGDTWSCLSYWGHVCLSYVVSVMFVLYCLIGLIGPPRPKVGRVRTVAPGGGAAGGRWAGADIQRPTCKNMHAFACCARAHAAREKKARVRKESCRARGAALSARLIYMQWRLSAESRSSRPRWRARPQRARAGGWAAIPTARCAAAASSPWAWRVLQLLFVSSAHSVCSGHALQHGLSGLLAMGAARHGLAVAEAADDSALVALMRAAYAVLTCVALAGERVEESGSVGW